MADNAQGLAAPVAPPQQGQGPLQVAAAGDAALQNTFAAARAKAATGSVDKDFQSLIGAPATEAAPGAAEGATPAPGAPAAPLNAAASPPVPLGWKILNGIGSAAKDIGGGAIGAPKHLVGGIIDYGNNLMKFADTVVKHAEEKGLQNVYFQLFDKDGKWAPQMQSAEQFRAAQAAGEEGVFQVPTVGSPDTVTGNIIRTGTSFLMGRGTMAGKGAGMAANAVADFVSGATSMDPNQPRLSNVLNSVAPNVLTDWLKASPADEGTVLGHVKSGLEMAGLGTAITGVVKALKAAKQVWLGTPGAEGAAEGGAPGAAEAPANAPGSPAGAPPAAAADDMGAAASAAPGQAAAPTQGPTAGVMSLLPKDALELQFDAEINAAKARVSEAGAGAKPPFPEGTTPTGMNAEVARLQNMGYPEPETGSPLSAPSPKMETVEVSPELGKRFETYMAQERGDLGAPGSAVEGTANADLRSADFSSTGANPVKVNLNMINGPDDLKDAISRVSSQIPAQAIRHNDAVLDAAQSAGMTAEEFLAGPGGALKDTEVVGLRMVMNDAASQFLNLAKEASAPGAAPEAKAQALAAYAKFNDITSYLEAAKAESGRSVQAWGIPVAGSNIPYAEAVKRIAEVTGGPEGDEFLSRMGALQTPQQVAAAARAAQQMTGNDYFMYGWYNALLGPRTVIKKGISDAFMATWNLATRYAAEKFGPSGAVQPGETAALFQGYTGSFKDGLQAALAALRTGRSQFMSGAQTMDSLDFGNVEQLAQTAPQLPAEAPTMAAVDYLRAALPTSWIGAFDDFAKTINYRAELNSLAYRKMAAKGLDGADLESAIDQLKAQPPMWLHQQAVQNALSNTFQDPLTGIAANIKAVADSASIPIGHGGNFELPVGRILMPFVKVPVNIMKWSYSNSPLALAFPSARISAELAAGGATRDLALAKVGLGTALSTSFAGLALSGMVTGRGPSDPELNRAWRAAGNEPNSVNIGGKQYSYNMLEPAGMMAGVLADTYDVMRFAKEEDAGTAAASLVFGTGEALMSKTYLQGIAEFFKAIENPDAQSARWWDRLIGTAVPNTVADLRRGQDPWVRAHYDLLSGIENRLPYVSQRLPPQRTLWGDAIPLEDGYAPFLTGTAGARMLSPVSVGPALSTQPIDKWIWDNRMAFPRGPDNKLGISRPGVVQNFSSGSHVAVQVELTPAQHDRLQVLAGNELKDPSTGMGARDALNALVEGTYPGGMQKQWDSAEPAAQALIVQSMVNKYREAAKYQLRGDFPDLDETIRAGANARANQLTGTR